MKKLLFFLFIITTLTIHAEPQGIKITNSDISDAVEDGKVYAIKSDNHKHVWIATYNGLVCYEGGEYTLTPVPSLTHHPFPAIRALEFDSANDWLWIGSWNHLYCYNLRAKRFITIADSLIYQTTLLKCKTPGEVLAYTQHGLYLEQISDSFPEGRTIQINQKPYNIIKPLTRQEVSKMLHLKEERSYTVIVLEIVFFVCLIIVFALIYKRKKKGDDDKSFVQEVLLDNKLEDVAAYHENFAEKAERITDKNLHDENFGIERLAQELAVSRAQLFRKMKAANGMTPSEFITRRRMMAAENLLKNSGLTISDIAMKVGISDVSNFRRTYIKVFGHQPERSGT